MISSLLIHRNDFSTAPVLSQSICQGTILLWCSIAEINTSSPGFKIEEIRLQPNYSKVVPGVNNTS
jgi:hypothetical protein